MINRNKGTHSYDKAVNIDNNKIISNFRKEHKLKIYTSPKMIKLTKEKNLEQKNINEIKKEPVEKNKIISSNFEQSKTAYNSPDKDEFELCLSKKNKNKINFSLKEDNNKFEEKKLMNLHTIKNKINAKNKDYQLWEKDNHIEVIWSYDLYIQKLMYIHMNPVVQEIVEKPENYLYSSARDYCGEKGLIDVIVEK